MNSRGDREAEVVILIVTDQDHSWRDVTIMCDLIHAYNAMRANTAQVVSTVCSWRDGDMWGVMLLWKSSRFVYIQTHSWRGDYSAIVLYLNMHITDSNISLWQHDMWLYILLIMLWLERRILIPWRDTILKTSLRLYLYFYTTSDFLWPLKKIIIKCQHDNILARGRHNYPAICDHDRNTIVKQSLLSYIVFFYRSSCL